MESDISRLGNIDQIHEDLLSQLSSIVFNHELDADQWKMVLEGHKNELAETTYAAAQTHYLGGLGGSEYINRIHALVAKIELLENLVSRIELLSKDTV